MSAKPQFPSPENFAQNCLAFFSATQIHRFMAIHRYKVIFEIAGSLLSDCSHSRIALIDPTNACNMHCKGCWAGDYSDTQEIEYKRLDKLIRECRRMGVVEVLYTGGEPLLRSEELLRLAAKHRRTFFGAFTNGTLIDRDFVKQLKKLGNMTVFLSIEGWREETDFRRGAGAFDRTVKAMELLKEEGVAFGFSVCYHKMNYKVATSDAFLDFLREHGAVLGWAFSYRPIGKNADVSLCLNAQERDDCRLAYESYVSRHQLQIIDLFNSGHKLYGCVGASNGFFHVNANGDVEPCAFCHYSDANINEVSLRKALRSPFFRAFRAAQPFSDNILTPCPMMDVPDKIIEITEKTGARSTHTADAETARDFAAKARPFADEWAEYTKDPPHPPTDTEKKMNLGLSNGMAFKRWLGGDARIPADGLIRFLLMIGFCAVNGATVGAIAALAAYIISPVSAAWLYALLIPTAIGGLTGLVLWVRNLFGDTRK